MSERNQTIAIIGAGQAGFATATKLRALGHSGRIVMFGDEPHPPYQRPPLSKGYLLGDVARERLFFRPPDFYAEQGIELVMDQRVALIDPRLRQIETLGAMAMRYDKLVLATGASPTRLPQHVTNGLNGVFYMRDLRDADQMVSCLQPGRSALVVGGGYIGLEGAAVAAKAGMKVTLVEAAPRILGRVAAPPTADYIRALHQAHGVDIREGVGLVELHSNGEGHVGSASLSDGRVVTCDMVLVGIGVRPNTGLAIAAGLAVENGIRTDAQCRTSDPNIFAIGDCASFPWQGCRVRLESVGNAIDMGELVAAVLMGQDLCYEAKPWFWSDQFDMKLQIAGLSQGHDGIVTRNGDNGARSHWYYSGERLLAVDAINDPRAFMVAKKLLATGKSVNKSAIGDPTRDLKTLALTA